MERATRIIKDLDTQRTFDFIFQNAMGNPIIFTAVPTLVQMKANTWGVFGTTIYVKFGNGTGISIAGVALS